MLMTNHASVDPEMTQSVIQGTFYINRAFFQGGTHRLHMDLENQSGPVRACWEGEQYLRHGNPIQPGSIVHAVLNMNRADHFYQVHEIEPLAPWKLCDLNWIPRRWILPNCKSALCSLSFLLEHMHYTALRGFVIHALSDPLIGRAFFQVRASLDNHHAYAGGLVEHSVECAEWASYAALFMGLDEVNMDATIVGALFHDIGKVRTHTRDGLRKDSSGLRHEQLTLEVLAEPLRRLELEFPEAAGPLRSALAWRGNRLGDREFYLPSLLIKLTDQCSAASEKFHRVFDDAPPSRAFVWLDEEGRWLARIPPQNGAHRIVRKDD